MAEQRNSQRAFRFSEVLKSDKDRGEYRQNEARKERADAAVSGRYAPPMNVRKPVRHSGRVN